MIISHRYRFVFVKTGKTAGSSVEVALSQLCGPEDVVTPLSVPEEGHEPRNWGGLWNPGREIMVGVRAAGSVRGAGIRTPVLRHLRARKRFYEHIPAWRARARLPRKVWVNYTTFCVERDPFEKVLSGWAWWQHRFGPIGLDGYLDRIEERVVDRTKHAGFGILPFNLPNYTDPLTGEVIVDRVLRYERLDDELAATLRPLGVPFDPPLAPKAKTGVRPAGATLSSRQVERVARLFREELDLLRLSG